MNFLATLFGGNRRDERGQNALRLAQQRQLEAYLNNGGEEFASAIRAREGYEPMPEQARFTGFRDMFDGGGPGQSGPDFAGGPLSGVLNALGVNPMPSLRAPEVSMRPQPRPAYSPQREMPSAYTPSNEGMRFPDTALSRPIADPPAPERGMITAETIEEARARLMAAPEKYDEMMSIRRSFERGEISKREYSMRIYELAFR